MQEVPNKAHTHFKAIRPVVVVGQWEVAQLIDEKSRT
jgi:hypothetical protein